MTADRLTLDADLAAVAQALRRSTVQVRASGGHGSGLITSSDGSIVTNAHVVRGRRLGIVLADGREMPAEIIALSPQRDLARLQIDARDLAPAAFRDARTLRTGEIVAALGHPLGVVGAFTAGIVHAADPRGRHVVADLLLLPGNSGGPLADAEGRVVGVNAMVVDGLAVAIASNVVRRFLAAPSARPFVGITARPVTLAVSGESRLGMLVTGRDEGAPAARAGVLVGDVIIGVDGRLFSAENELGDVVDDAEVGADIRLDVVRAGRVIGIAVTIGDASRKWPRAA